MQKKSHTPQSTSQQAVNQLARRRLSRAEQRLTHFYLQGEIHSGKRTKYAIQGEDFVITSKTWVVGTLALQKIAKVRGVVVPGIGKEAIKVEIIR